ncbi:hypothetical protein PV762_20090 [Mitsuaria sp. CC2]|uniref:hypothetical protein n=1 Tax=Mitsuaria sp. CC2 TaxID=3029186 RepID=UPI003B8B3CD6
MLSNVQNRAVPSPIDTTPGAPPNTPVSTPSGGQGGGAATQFPGLAARPSGPSSSGAGAPPRRSNSLPTLPSQQTAMTALPSGNPTPARPTLRLDTNIPPAQAQTVSPSQVPLPETPVSPSKVPLPATPVSPSKVALPETPVSPSKIALPDSPVSPSKVPLPETPVSPSKVALPETPVSPSKVPLPESPVSDSKPQVPESSVAAGKRPATSLGGPALLAPKLPTKTSSGPPRLNLASPQTTTPAPTPTAAAAAATATATTTAAASTSTTAVATTGTPPANVSGKQLTDALLATLGQRATTYGGGHAIAWAVQAITLMSAGAAGASKEALGVSSNVLGGLAAALGKEFIGEHMKTRPSLGATIKLPSATTLQTEGPRVMAGFNDMWTAIAGGMSGVAIASKLTPALTEGFKAKGMSEPMAQATAMMVTAVAQRAVSAGFDTVSDLTSTVMKSRLPGATGGTAVNDKVDYATMKAGMAARMMINWGLTLPVGIPVGLGKALTDGNAFAKAAASSAPAWAGLNFWINAKMNMAPMFKKDEPAVVTPQPPIAMTAMTATTPMRPGNDNNV